MTENKRHDIFYMVLISRGELDNLFFAPNWTSVIMVIQYGNDKHDNTNVLI